VKASVAEGISALEVRFAVVEAHAVDDAAAAEKHLVNFRMVLCKTWRVCVDEKLVPNLLRGRGMSIGGDLNVDEEGFEQNGRNLAITTPRLCLLPTWVHMNWPRQEG
jgi:hypothetical protein